MAPTNALRAEAIRNFEPRIHPGSIDVQLRVDQEDRQTIVTYDELAMVEVDRFSKATTSGLIVSLAMVGALVAAPIAVVPAVAP